MVTAGEFGGIFLTYQITNGLNKRFCIINCDTKTQSVFTAIVRTPVTYSDSNKSPPGVCCAIVKLNQYLCLYDESSDDIKSLLNIETVIPNVC